MCRAVCVGELYFSSVVITKNSFPEIKNHEKKNCVVVAKIMKNISVFWPFLAFLSFCHCCSNLKNGFFSNEDGNCLPCQEENVAYFGNNIKVNNPFFKHVRPKRNQKVYIVII